MAIFFALPSISTGLTGSNDTYFAGINLKRINKTKEGTFTEHLEWFNKIVEKVFDTEYNQTFAGNESSGEEDAEDFTNDVYRNNFADTESYLNVEVDDEEANDSHSNRDNLSACSNVCMNKSCITAGKAKCKYGQFAKFLNFQNIKISIFLWKIDLCQFDPLDNLMLI